MRKENKILSLKEYCDPCGAYCCSHGTTIGSPIISEDEKKRIIRHYERKHPYVAKGFQKITLTKEHYYVILEKPDKTCYFIKESNCLIQAAKPLDCLIYPIKAVYESEISHIIDISCPASKFLTHEFIETAKKLALESVKRFDRATYAHWLENFVGWVKKPTAKKLEEWLKSIE